MKHLVPFKLAVVSLVSILYTSCNTSTPDYSGKWEDSGEHYENILELVKLYNSQNNYRFIINSWRESYDPLTDDTNRFLGYMMDSIFTVEVIDGHALYTDEKRDDGLYRKGEARCSLRFAFNDTMVRITTEACTGIYGGYSVEFDGVYHKVED